MGRVSSVIAIFIVASMLVTISPTHQVQAETDGISDRDYWKLVEALTEYNGTSPVPRRVAAYDIWERFEE